jgi:hypothetical protein
MGFRAGIPQVESRIRNENKPWIVPCLPGLLLPARLITAQHTSITDAGRFGASMRRLFAGAWGF